MNDELMGLPEGWEWAALEDISNHISGTAFKSTDFTTQGIQVIRLGNVYKGQLNLSRDPVFLPTSFTATNSVLKPGNIIVSQTGTRFKRDYGHFVLIPENAPKLFLNQRLLAISCHSLIEPEYVVLASKLKTYQDYFFSQETGGVNQGNVGVAGVMKGSIPLAPSNEQKRIVAQIEALRERSQKAKAALEAIPELCDRFRQSVLAAAFRGDLTADWREQNPDVETAPKLLEKAQQEHRHFYREESAKAKVEGKPKPKEPTCLGDYELAWREDVQLPESWMLLPLGKVCMKVTDGTHDTPKTVDEGIPYITAQHVKSGFIDFKNAFFLPETEHKVIYSRCNPQNGDVLLVNIGAGTATPALVNVDFEFSMKNIALLKPDKKTIESEYLEYHQMFMKSSIFSRVSRGGAQPFMGLNLIRTIPFSLPPLQEQREIVARIKELLDKISFFEQFYQRTQTQLDRLNQSILAKAFRGELVEQDPNDEPASVLLDRIRAEREAQQPAKKSQRKGAAGRRK